MPHAISAPGTILLVPKTKTKLGTELQQIALSTVTPHTSYPHDHFACILKDILGAARAISNGTSLIK